MAEQITEQINTYDFNGGRFTLKETLNIIPDQFIFGFSFAKVTVVGRKPNETFFYELRNEMNKPIFITDENGFDLLFGGGEILNTYNTNGKVIVPFERLLYLGDSKQVGLKSSSSYLFAKTFTNIRKGKEFTFYQMRTQENVPVLTVDEEGYNLLTQGNIAVPAN